MMTCDQIAERLDDAVSAETIRLYLQEKNYTYKKTSKVPPLSEDDKVDRVEFAELYRDYDFTRTFFTDECHFDLNGSVRGWAPKGTRIPQRSYAYPATVQVWGAITSDGHGFLETYEGRLKGINYQEMLEERFVPYAQRIVDEDWDAEGEEWTLVQDGAPCHTSKVAMDYMELEEIHVPDWPARSPDLNPIENLWAVLKERVYRRRPSTAEDLLNYIFEEFDLLEPEDLAAIASTMNARLEQCIERNGSAIDY